MLCARQTLELCANPSCPNPNNFACELFGAGGGCRQYLRKSLRALVADPTTECCTYTLHVWESRRLLKQASCLELRVAGNWKATKLQTCCMNVCIYYMPWSELTSVFQCIAEHFDEILCNWKKKSFNLAEHLSMKEGSLFCFLVMRSTEPGCFRSFSWCLWKALDEEGVHGLGSMTFGLAVQKFLNIEWFLHWKLNLNCSWKFWRNWNVPLVLLERSWWAGFTGIYLVSFGFRRWEILTFKRFLPLKIQINSKKPGFGRKNQLRTW